MKPSYEQLEERLRDANMRIAELTGGHLAGDIRSAIGLEAKCARVLAMLYAAPGMVSAGLIWSEVFADPATGEGPDLSIVKVSISKIRRRLRALDLSEPTIVHDWGFGYRLIPAVRIFVADRLRPTEIAA
ncbi:hypothetical protein ACFPIF_15665 [Brevundimonas faecalis]|uniref:hypothetical protein n=1 Tax=Brevundimonas faecalis TaxID=947378 RepID=UPI003615BD3F